MGKRGPKPIDKPDFWSKEFYLKQKELKIPDVELASMLNVSIETFLRWKRELGFKAGDFKHLKPWNKGKKGRYKQPV